MKTKKAQVIILPTEDKSRIVLNEYKSSNRLLLDNSIKGYFDQPIKTIISRGYQPQHLYIISDDPIVKGDWFLVKDSESVHKCRGFNDIRDIESNNNLCYNYKFCKKVLATTDKNLTVNSSTNIKGKVQWQSYLPQIPKSFIEEYCKLGGIDEVLVKCKCRDTFCGCVYGEICTESDLTLKVDSHNNITIHPIKQSYTREEVEELCKSAYHVGFSEEYNDYTSPSYQDFNDWKNKNL